MKLDSKTLFPRAGLPTNVAKAASAIRTAGDARAAKAASTKTKPETKK